MESHLITVDDGVGLHVGSTGAGPDVVVLTGGPGCVTSRSATRWSIPMR